MKAEIADVSHVFRGLDGRVIPVLDHVNLKVEPGELVAIVGPSGCGKTTLANMLAGLEVPMTGSVTVNSSQPRPGDKQISYVLARDSLLPWRTALDNAAIAMEVHGVAPAERRQRAQSALASVGLAGFEDHYPAQLSHGMRQRVALARSFATRPQLLLMDEPFSALDAQTRYAVHDIFLGLWSQNRTTAVLITHDLSEAVGLANRVVVMTRRPGQIKAIHDIPLASPRSMARLQGDPQFHSIYERVWQDLRAEFIEESASPAEMTAG